VAILFKEIFPGLQKVAQTTKFRPIWSHCLNIKRFKVEINTTDLKERKTRLAPISQTFIR